MNLLRLTIFSLTLFFSQASWGRIDFEDAVFPELITSARALAMGNAFIAKVDDSAAAFYNPAGLGTTRYGRFHLSNLHLEFNNGWKNIATGGSITDASSNFTKSFSVDGVRGLLNEDRGKISHTRFQINPNFTVRFFSLGYLYSKQLRATTGTAEDALFEYADRTDHGPYAALSIPMFGGIFKIGGTATYLNRSEAIGEVDRNQTIELGDGDYQSGTMFLVTTGARLSLPVAGLPTFAAKLNNTASQEFSPSDGSAGAPDKLQQSLDLGFSITPQIGKVTRFHMEINYKDATNKYTGTTSARKFAVGAELDLMRRFFVRVGYGDGFGSGGFGVRSKVVEFDLTTYAIDSTSSAFRGKEDRHFVFSLSSGF